MALESVHLSLLGTAPAGQPAPASASSSLRGRPEQSALQKPEPEVPSNQTGTKARSSSAGKVQKLYQTMRSSISLRCCLGEISNCDLKHRGADVLYTAGMKQLKISGFYLTFHFFSGLSLRQLTLTTAPKLARLQENLQQTNIIRLNNHLIST